MLASLLSATASPPCTLDIPAHNVHYDLRGVPGVSGVYEGASDRSVNEGLAEASELLQAGHRSQPWFELENHARNAAVAIRQVVTSECSQAAAAVSADVKRAVSGKNR